MPVNLLINKLINNDNVDDDQLLLDRSWQMLVSDHHIKCGTIIFKKKKDQIVYY